jgi:polyisoprenoid-binding protein YceI
MKFSLIAAALMATVTVTLKAQEAPKSSVYTVEPTHTFVNWEAQHFGTSTNRGRFDKHSGTVTLDKATNTGKVEITIEMASISTGTIPFDSHLKNKDFFNVDVHPKSTFKGDFKLDAGKIVAAQGQLTMLGVTKPVTLKGKSFNCYTNPFFRKEVCGGDFEATIKRSEYGMTFGLPGIPDDIRLLIQIEAVAQ